jgi:hypothetical protein
MIEVQYRHLTRQAVWQLNKWKIELKLIYPKPPLTVAAKAAAMRHFAAPA